MRYSHRAQFVHCSTLWIQLVLSYRLKRLILFFANIYCCSKNQNFLWKLSKTKCSIGYSMWMTLLRLLWISYLFQFICMKIYYFTQGTRLIAPIEKLEGCLTSKITIILIRSNTQRDNTLYGSFAFKAQQVNWTIHRNNGYFKLAHMKVLLYAQLRAYPDFNGLVELYFNRVWK